MILSALLILISVSLSSIESVSAQANTNNMTSEGSQNQTTEFADIITGPNQQVTNDTLPLGSSLGEEIRENVKITLANATMIAEEDVGPKSHTEEARIGVWNDGTMVYFVLVLDDKDHFHGVVVNAEKGTIIESDKITGANSLFLLLL